MCFFTLPRHIATVLLFVVACAPASAAPKRVEGANRPFVERVRPDDYFGAEKLFDESFSRTHELVVLRTTAAKPVSVLAVKRAVSGDGYTLTMHLASDTTPGGWLKISEELDTDIGRQVLRAFELKLHRQVALSNFKRTPSKTDTDLWLYQRLHDGEIDTALISMEATLDNPAASAFIDGFLGVLQDLIGKEGKERAAVLQKIDRISTEIILAESP